MNTVIVKYNAGNVQSVLYALERVGFTKDIILTDDPETIKNADKVIFPGVGHAASAMAYLKQKGLDRLLPALTQPFLGICLGMQLMCSHSEEGNTPCLGIFEEKVLGFKSEVLKIPQIGWNQITDLKTSLFDKVPEQSYIYLVHGYYAAVGSHTIARTEYIQPYSSALHKDNFYGVQFHPEKSAAVGEQILYNFMTNI